MEEMRISARTATNFMLGLALYHAYGIVIILYNIERWVNIPMFGVYRGYDEPAYWAVRAKITVIIHLFILVYILRWLIAGLRKFRAGAWYGSLAFCCLLILVRWAILTAILKLKLADGCLLATA